MWGLPGGVKKGVMEKSDASESKGLKCGVNSGSLLCLASVRQTQSPLSGFGKGKML